MTPKDNLHDKILSSWLVSIKKIVRENLEVFFTRADKGNVSLK